MRVQRSGQWEPPAELNRLTEAVIGAAIEVHRLLGPGLLEAVYEEALCVELGLRRIRVARQTNVDLRYKGHFVGRARLDLIVENQVVIELKAVEALHDIHQAQLISYLRATGFKLGLLINFNVPVLRDGIKRVICS